MVHHVAFNHHFASQNHPQVGHRAPIAPMWSDEAPSFAIDDQARTAHTARYYSRDSDEEERLWT